MTTVTPQVQQQTSAPVEPVPAKEAPAPVLEQKKEEEQLSPKFAALARQQKAVRKMELDLKAREDAVKMKEYEYANNYVPKAKLKEDPYSVLEAEGVPYDTVVNSALNRDPQGQMIRQLEKKIADLEAKHDQSIKATQQDKTDAYEQALGQLRVETRSLVDVGTDYELIKAEGAEEAVVELIKETFEKEKTLLTVEEAAKKVEEYLFEKAVQFASLEKVKKKLTPQEVPVETHKPQMKSQMKTLTNASTTVSSKPLTDKERKARAIAAFMGQPTAT